MKLTVAACSFEIDKAKYGRIQLLPYGKFRATDGRPTDVEAWYVTDTNGADVVALANSQKNPLPIDYEHQILHSQQNGKEAPSAGWMEYLYFNPQGIFADVRWTDKAADYIKNGEYRYISAVFAYDTNGYVRKIFHAALTNNPRFRRHGRSDGCRQCATFKSTKGKARNGQKISGSLVCVVCFESRRQRSGNYRKSDRTFCR